MQKLSGGKSVSQKIVWHTEVRKVKDLLPYAKNPRVISDEQMEGLKRSLSKFNVAELPAINKDGTIVAGHQRVRALILLGRGEEKIDVRVPSRQLTKSEFKDYLLTSNRSGGSWDYSLLSSDFDLDDLKLAGFDDIDLSHIFDDNAKKSDSEWNEEEELKKIKRSKIKIKKGDLFALGKHRLICGSSLDKETVEKLMDGARADLIDDDIPFNIGLSYNKGVGNKKHYGGTINDSKTDDEYRTFVKNLLENALSVTKDNAHVIFWCDERYVWLLQVLYQELGINSKRLLVWVKNNSSPTPNVAFNKATEFAVYGTIGSPYLCKRIQDLNEIQNNEMTNGNDLHREITDNSNLMLVKRLPSSQYSHPTEKSPLLHYKAIKRCTRVGDIVLDLTAGSGSILVACEQLKRVAYVCELEPVFCQLIINHYESVSSNKAKLIKNIYEEN
ncbi:MAG: DNA modification methylase [bacterium]